MELKTLRAMPESGIENIVTDLMVQINQDIAYHALPGVIKAIRQTIPQSFVTHPETRTKGSAAIILGRKPEDFRTYLLSWEKEGSSYRFSFSGLGEGCIDAEVQKGYDAMCRYFNEKGFPGF